MGVPLTALCPALYFRIMHHPQTPERRGAPTLPSPTPYRLTLSLTRAGSAVGYVLGYGLLGSVPRIVMRPSESEERVVSSFGP